MIPTTSERPRARALPASRRGALTLTLTIALTFGAASCSKKAPSPEAVSREAMAATTTLVLDGIPERPGGDLLVGAATVDLTPYDKAAAGDVYIAGFGPGRTSEGVLDPVTGRVLYVDDGKQWVVLAWLDFVGLLNDEVRGIRGLVTRDHPERVIVGSTHNHEGPDTMGYWGPGVLLPIASGKDPEYMTWMRGQVADAIARAVVGAKPARLRFGTATVEEGVSANLWFPDDPSRKDDQMTVLAAEDLDGKRIATLVNYACHAEALFENNKRLSADFPGRLYRELETYHPDSVPIFVPGAIGGMVIPYPNRWDKRDEFDDFTLRLGFIDRVGDILAQTAEGALAEGSDPIGPQGVTLGHETREIWLALDNTIFEVVTSLGIVSLGDRPTQDERFRAEVHRVDLGPARILTVPGEIFPSLGFLYKRWLATPYPFVFGLATDELGYIMGAAEFEDSTYEYEQSMSVGPETGPTLTRAVHDLLGATEPPPPEVIGPLGSPGGN